MSETYGTTSNDDHDDTRELGTVEVFPGREDYGYSGTTGTGGASSSASTKDVAKDEAKATGQQAKEGARHVAEVGKDEVKNVAQETGQQAKELWQQTRTQLMDQSAQQQTRVAEGLRSLSEELSGMARSSEQQGMASDLAHQASQRMGDVAGWLDQRDPGSLVSEVKQFARQRPGAFLAAAALAGLVGGRLSRGLVADHQETTGASDEGQGGTPAYATGSAYATGAGTAGYGTSTGTGSAYGTGTAGYVETVGPVGTTGVPTTSTAPVGDGTEYSDYGSPLDGGESPR